MPTAGLYIGELLLRARLVDEPGLEQGLHAQSLYGGRLGTNLVELGLVSLADLGRQLAQQHAVPEATPQELVAADPRLLERITPEMCAKYHVFPLRAIAGKVLHVAMLDPADLVQLDELAFAAGMKIQPHATPELLMYYFLEQRCGIPREERYRRLTDDGLGVITSEINLSFAPVRDESVPSAAPPQRWAEEVGRASRVPTGPMPRLEGSSGQGPERRGSTEVPHLAPRPPRGSAESPRVGTTTLSFEQRAPSSIRGADDSQPTVQTRQAARGTPSSTRKPTMGARLAPRDLATGPLPPSDQGRTPAPTSPSRSRPANATIEGSDEDEDLVYLDAVPRTSTSPSNVAVQAPLRADSPAPPSSRPTPSPGRTSAQRTPRPTPSPSARVPTTPAPPQRTPRPITSPSARIPTSAPPAQRTPRPITSPGARIPSPSSSMPPLAPQPALAPPARPVEAVRRGRADLPDLPVVPVVTEEASVPPLISLEAVFSGLDQAVEGSMVGRLLVLGASAQASLSVLFHLQGEMVTAQAVIGSPLTVEKVQQLTLPLSSSYLLRQASSLGGPVWGTVARDPLQQVVSGYLRAPQPEQVCVLPVSLGGRVAQLLCVQFPVGAHLTKEIYDDLIRLADKGSTTYARLAAARR